MDERIIVHCKDYRILRKAVPVNAPVNAPAGAPIYNEIAITPNIILSNHRPFVVLGGINVLESYALADEAADHYSKVCQKLSIPYVFKASFDKANRSSMHSFRGPGLDKGLQWLADIKAKYNVPVITDVHEPIQADPVGEVVDIVQLPAFLARQTDLVAALAQTGKPIHVKKPQFLAPHEMRHIITKAEQAGNDKIILCERGTVFGYNNLIVDMLGMDQMRAMAPVTFDVTHALQYPGGRNDSAGGRRAQAMALARSGMALGLAGLFLEAHPSPDMAKCDGPSALPLDKLEPFLANLKALDDLVKSQPVLHID